jgi:hypothetical protein
LKLDRIFALAHPANTGSQLVMQRVGMRYDKTEHYKDALYDGDMVYYVVSREEYQRDDAPYLKRVVVGDEAHSFSRAFEQRRQESGIKH